MSMACTPKNFPVNEWLCKTNFSFLKGASHPSEIINTAHSCGYDSICINDFNGVYGLARAYNDLTFLKKNTPSNLKLNYGAEINLKKDHFEPLLNQATLVLNAQNWNGFVNLNKILTFANKSCDKNEASISVEELGGFDLAGIFAVIPMRGSVKYFIKNQNKLDILKFLFNENLFLAITKTFNRYSDSLIGDTYAISKKYGIHKIFSQDIFFSHRNEKGFHDVLTAIRLNKILQNSTEHFFPNGERSFHTKTTYFKIFSSFPDFSEIIQKMHELNEACEFSLSQIKYQYPKEFIPEGFTAQTFLEKISWQGAVSRFGEHLPTKIIAQISKELDLIEHLGFADYFLTVWDIVRWARSQNILCQGRGSAANSAVCFVLGVTSCDPTLFDLLFERFISKERGDPPDIDIDFEHERREEVIQYIYNRYGRARAAMVANVITFKSKSAVRAVGKAFGVDEKNLKYLSETIGGFVFRGKDLNDKINYAERDQISLPNNLTKDLWAKLSTRLLDFPRHLGLHSGGFIISQHLLSELVAQEPATMENRTVIQWAKDDIEELGFFKIDCLALGMLTAIRKCFDIVKTHYDHELDLYNIPQNDSATYSMIQKAKTEGTFQIESRAQMSMLPRLRPKCFYDLVIEIAIIRPGPIQGEVIHPYLRRRDGLEPIIYPHKSVKEILSKTLGIIIFQEQLMRTAIALGDFTPGEADMLRKQIGAWNSKAFNRNLTPFLEKLVKGMERKNIPRPYIEQALEQMKGFAHYGFPESHSISFAFIAYASCYLKCHYPAAFYVSVMNSQPMGFYSPHALLQSARREGIKILPISVNSSDWDHKLELVDSKPDRPKQYAIRLGLRIVSGLSKAAVEKITHSRKSLGQFQNFDDFVRETQIYRDDYTAIAAANGFHCFGLDRFDALWLAEAVPFKPLIDIEERKLRWKKLNPLENIQLDFSALGTSIEVHPTRLMREKYWPYSIDSKEIKSSAELENMKPQNNVTVFGMILVKQAPPSANGMVFYTLEDETGFINLAFTPTVYHKYFEIAEKSGFICITGKLQKVSNYHSVLVSKVHPQDRSKVVNLKTLERQIPEVNIAYNSRNFY